VFCGIAFLMRRVWDSTTRSTLRDSEYGKNCVLEVDAEPAETYPFFAAMLLVFTLEGVSVYWLGLAGLTTARIQSSNLAGRWTAATLPQCWLLGALLVLFYRVSAMLVPPQSWGRAEAESNRRAFLRLWCWTVALAAQQVGAMYMDSFTMGVH
jgi:hypothetical protein